mmetsp:Transcript_14299/g.30543  ORF Transcript_14299/g.30543 Transcript_14299/m.30543 type:complete len:236 (-) Transcript_14299:158-865(-)
MVLYHDRSTVSIETCHGTHRRMHHILRLLLRQYLFRTQLRPPRRISNPPFVYIHGHLRPQRFRQHHHIPHFRAIALDVLPLPANTRGHATDHRPWIQHRLTSGNDRPTLQTSIIEPPHHLPRAYLPILLGHIPTCREQHQHEIALPHPLGVQIAQHVRRTDPPLQIRTIDQRKEEIGGADADVSLTSLSHGTIEGNLSVGCADVLIVAEVEGEEHGLQLRLGDLAGSSFEGGEGG